MPEILTAQQDLFKPTLRYSIKKGNVDDGKMLIRIQTEEDQAPCAVVKRVSNEGALVFSTTLAIESRTTHIQSGKDDGSRQAQVACANIPDIGNLPLFFYKQYGLLNFIPGMFSLVGSIETLHEKVDFVPKSNPIERAKDMITIFNAVRHIQRSASISNRSV